MNDFLHRYGKPDVHFSLDNIKTPAAVLDNPNLSDEQTDKIIEHAATRLSYPDGKIRSKHLSKILNNPRLSKENFDKFASSELSSGDESLNIDDIVNNKHADAKLFDHILDNHSHNIYTLSATARAKGLSPHHIDKIIDHNYSGIDETLAERQDLQPHHIQRLIDTKDQYTRNKILTHQKEIPANIIHDVIDGARMMNPAYSSINPIYKVLRQKHLNQDHIKKLLNHDNPDVREITQNHLSSRNS